jgi:transcription initiation factor TFIIIB Brf1 subunit/transcription initiation factor TFIIB
MAAQKCADCSGVEFDEIDGVLVCMQCGTELEGSVNLVEDSGSAWVGKSSTNTNNSHTAYRHRDQSDIKKRLVANAVAMLCSALRAPQAVQERIRHMVGQVQPELGAGRRMKALCAACTYIVMRREPYRYVVMLLQVADAANLGDRGVVEVARAYKHAMAKLEIKWGDIHQEGDLEALVDRCGTRDSYRRLTH